MINPTNPTVYTEWWSKSLAVELFDVASLLKHLRSVLDDAEFGHALTMLHVTPEEFRYLMDALNDNQIRRERHSFTPDLERGEEWTKPLVLKTFQWINRFRGDLWKLVAQILDLARFLSATAEDLQEAGHNSSRFNHMETADWQAILDSGATSFSKWGRHWDVKLFEDHVHGQSSG